MSNRLITGEAIELAPGLRRVLAPNPGRMTGPGTNTYLLGESEVAVIDPGPAQESHVAAILNGAPGSIATILVTHTHPDHSPAARLLADRTGARLLGRSAPDGEVQDRSFSPDHEPADGELLRTGDFPLRAIHTPGHASNHLCYLLEEQDLLFTGDHIMNGSTVVINPPDGDMRLYVESLRRLKSLRLATLAPGHGELIETPQAAVDWLIDHRLAREAKVIGALKKRPESAVDGLVPLVYQDVGEHLHALAARSLLAHLLKLRDEGRAVCSRDRWRFVP